MFWYNTTPMTQEGLDNTNPVPESDRWSSRGEVPGSLVPGMIVHNGDEPTTPEELARITRDLNNGHPLEAASRRFGRLNVLIRDGTGWKILAGSTAAIGAAIGLFELTMKMLEIRSKTKR